MASQEGTGHGDSHKLEEQGWKRRGTIPLVWMPHLFESGVSLPWKERPYLDSFTSIDEDMVGHQETDWVTFYCLFFLTVCRAEHQPRMSVPRYVCLRLGMSACFQFWCRGNALHVLGTKGREIACNWSTDGASVTGEGGVFCFLLLLPRAENKMLWWHGHNHDCRLFEALMANVTLCYFVK